MTEFNKEEMINDYVEALKERDNDKLSELAKSLPESMGDGERIDVVETILDKTKDINEEGSLDEEVKVLENTIQTMQMLKDLAEQEDDYDIAQGQKDSTVEEGKDATQNEAEEAPESTVETADDSAAAESKDEAAVGDAPAEEVKEEKSEQ